MWSDFVQSKKALKVAIKRSKKGAWKEVCDNVDKDIWGKEYGIVKKRLLGHPNSPTMTMESVERVADQRHCTQCTHCTLWNVQYDGLLKLELPEGVKLIGFADDVAMIASARSEGMLINAADSATLTIIK